MSKQSPPVTLSIGLPVYNGEEYLKETLESLLGQSYDNFELIISDNASTDQTAAICRLYAKKDHRIKYHRQNKNIGEAPNFNYVLAKAQAEYFMWAGADDLWDENYLKILISLLKKNPQAVLAISNYYNLFNGQKFCTHQIKAYSSLNQISSLKHYLLHGSVGYFYGIYRTKALKNIGGYHIDNRPFFKLSDHLTIYKVLLKGSLVYTKKYLFYKRDTGLYFAKEEMIKKHHFNRDFIKKAYRYLHFPIFYGYDFFFAFKYLRKSNIKHSYKIKVSFYIIAHFIIENINFFKNICKDFIKIFNYRLKKNNQILHDQSNLS